MRASYQRKHNFMGTENRPGQHAPGQHQHNPKPGQEGDKRAQQQPAKDGDRMPGRHDQDKDRGGQKSEPGRGGGGLEKQAGKQQR
jgi:hypothetical protein